MTRKDIVLSIDKKYANLIFSGKKTFEFRKTAPANFFDERIGYSSGVCANAVNYRFWLYETKSSGGVGKIVGFFDCATGLRGRVWRIWDRCENGAGIDREAYERYFCPLASRPLIDAFAYEVAKVVKLSESEYMSIGYAGLKAAPQSWNYAGVGFSKISKRFD